MSAQGLQLSQRQKAEEKLKEFLERELGDYSFHWSVELADEDDTGEYCYFDIRYGLYEDSNNYIGMRVKPNKEHEDIEVDMHDGDYRVVEWFEPSIKYFWMLIKWE